MARSKSIAEDLAVDTLFDVREWDLLAEALSLSPRERQIIEGMTEGLKDSAVAQRLRVSLNTVRSHITRLHRKLDVQNRSSLLVVVFKMHRRLERPSTGTPIVEVTARRTLTLVRS